MIVACVATSLFAAPAIAQRSRGIDVSSWQGTVNWTSVRNSGIDFAFIRSTRGGTTGTYNQSDPNNTLGGNTLSQSFTDTRFVQNITGARNNGILAGPYHFARADILSYVDNGVTVTHTGTDEANHMLNVAGNYMAMGFMRPVYDLEAGDTQRSASSLTTFALDFINRIVAVKGYAPIVYINSNYANNEVDNRLRPYDLWLARYIDPATVNVQTVVDPPAAGGMPNVYGVWSTYTSGNPVHPTPRPWDFWQYTSTGTTPGVSGNNDLNVANGDREFVKDFLVPALWQTNASGDWSTASNWNGSAAQALPGPNDRVLLSRASTVAATVSTGAHAVRSIQSSQRLAVSGGSLVVEQYARFTTANYVSGGTFTTRDLTTATGTGMSVTGGTVNVTGTWDGTGGTEIGGGTINVNRLRVDAIGLYGTAHLNLTGTTSAHVVKLFFGSRGATQQPRLSLGTSTLIFDYNPASYTAGTPLNLLRVDLGELAPEADARFAIGYGEVVTLFPGTFPRTIVDYSTDSTSIVMKRVLRGDANLDGTVNFDDLLKLASSYNGNGTFWTGGDFTYDGVTNFDDLLMLASNYNTSASLAGDWSLATASVPEPTTLAMTTLAAVALLRRQRRA